MEVIKTKSRNPQLCVSQTKTTVRNRWAGIIFLSQLSEEAKKWNCVSCHLLSHMKGSCCPGTGYSAFILVWVCSPKSRKYGRRKRTAAKFGVLKKWFLTNLRLLELKFDQILGLRTELFPDFEALKCKFSKILGFQENVGSWGTEKIWNGGLREWSGGQKKRVLRVSHTVYCTSRCVHL